MMELLKFIGISALLYGAYYFLLRNEKCFRFNRFYLLLILPIAVIIPELVVRTTIVEMPTVEVQPSFVEDLSSRRWIEEVPVQVTAQAEPFTLDRDQLLWVSYFAICLIFLIRFILNLRSLIQLKKSAKLISHEGTKLAVSPQVKTTFTFFNRIYVNEKEFEKLGIDQQIMQHERSHVSQKHSFDIVWIELLNCFLWFNPVIYMIKKSVKLNHEFLADQGVIQITNDPINYQKLILKYSGRQLILNPLLASHLTFGETKKRFIIMFKTTNKKVAALKQVAATLAIIALAFLFGQEKVIAQEHNSHFESDNKTTFKYARENKIFSLIYTGPFPKNSDNVRFFDLQGNLVESTLENLSDDQKALFVSHSAKSEFKDEKSGEWRPIGFIESVTYQDKPAKIEQQTQAYQVFNLQMGERKIRFIYENGDTVYSTYSEIDNEEFSTHNNVKRIEFFYPPHPKVELDQALLNEFKDSKKYGVWLDGQRIDNEKLSSYSPSDFHHYFKSRLLPNAKNYGKHEFQVNLTTYKAWTSHPSKDGSWLTLIKEIKLKEKPKVKEKNKEKDKQKPQIKEVKQKKDGMPLPPPPPGPVRVELDDNTPIQYKGADGQTVQATYGKLAQDQLSRFESQLGKGQIWVSLKGTRPINNILIQNLDHPKIEIKLDGQKIEWEDFKDIDIADIHHYTPITKLDASKPKGENLDGYIYSFITEDYVKENPRSAGKWIDWEPKFKSINKGN